MNTKQTNAIDKGTAPWARCAYAIDVQDGRVCVSRGERRGRGIRVSRSDVSEAAAQAAAGRAAVIGCLPARVSFTRWLEAPLASRAKALKVAPTLLDIQLPFPLEHCLHTFVAASPTADGKTRCLAAAARRTDVESELQAMHDVQLDPVVLDHQGLALWTQALRELAAPAPAKGIRAVVSISGDRSCVAFGRGTAYTSSHAFREESADQVARLLHAQNPDTSPETAAIEWIWCGDGAGDATRLARVRDPLVARYPGTSVVAESPEDFLARALLTRALLDGPLRCNLRVGALTHADVTRRSARTSVTAALVLLLTAAALVAGNVAARLHLTAREAVMDREFAALRDDLLGYRHNVKGARAVETVRRKLEKDREDLQPFVDVFRPGVAADLRDVVSLGTKQGLIYSMITLGEEKAVISGTAADWDRPQALVDLLTARGYAVRLERQSVTEDERVPFTVVERGTP